MVKLEAFQLGLNFSFRISHCGIDYFKAIHVDAGYFREFISINFPFPEEKHIQISIDLMNNCLLSEKKNINFKMIEKDIKETIKELNLELAKIIKESN